MYTYVQVLIANATPLPLPLQGLRVMGVYLGWVEVEALGPSEGLSDLCGRCISSVVDQRRLSTCEEGDGDEVRTALTHWTSKRLSSYCMYCVWGCGLVGASTLSSAPFQLEGGVAKHEKVWLADCSSTGFTCFSLSSLHLPLPPSLPPPSSPPSPSLPFLPSPSLPLPPPPSFP